MNLFVVRLTPATRREAVDALCAHWVPPTGTRYRTSEQAIIIDIVRLSAIRGYSLPASAERLAEVADALDAAGATRAAAGFRFGLRPVRRGPSGSFQLITSPEEHR